MSVSKTSDWHTATDEHTSLLMPRMSFVSASIPEHPLSWKSTAHSMIRPRKSNSSKIALGVGLTLFGLSIVLFCVLGLAPGDMVVRPSPPATRVPIVNKGNLDVYPPFLAPNVSNVRNNSYIIHLTPDKIKDAIKALENVTDEYPVNWVPPYTRCWLKNPSYSKPCFYGRGWFGTKCSKENKFGYQEVQGTYNPCFIVRIEKAKTWKPVVEKKQNLPKEIRKYYDPAFFPVMCYLVKEASSAKIKNITESFDKGFSIHFFPQSSFDPKIYLKPAVAVIVEGIKVGQKTTVECAVVVENNFILWDVGVFRVEFIS